MGRQGTAGWERGPAGRGRDTPAAPAARTAAYRTHAEQLIGALVPRFTTLERN